LLTAVVLSLVTGFVVTVLAGGARDSSTPLRALAHPASLANRLTIVMTAEGRRTALVHRPPHHGPTAALVVVLHGANSSGERTEASLGWDQLADRDSFVVAYPNGIGHFWNAGNCCGPAHRLHVDDVQFLHDLRTQLVSGDHVDSHRVYAVGFSNGAMMAYAWACGRPDDLAGIGIVAGALVTRCDPAPALPVVTIHGTADRNVPIHGGIGPRSISHYRYPSLEESLAPFRAANHCATTPKTTDRPPVTETTWVCASGHTVTMIVASGLGHSWPGSRSSTRFTTSTPVAVHASTILWTILSVSHR
jgi:polyhydroxybutyrate depolymerase